MLRSPFQHRIRGAGGRACPHHSPAHTIAVPSEYSPSPLREGFVPYRRRRAVRAVVRAYTLSALREAVSASTARVPLLPPCAYSRSTGPCV
jgi:hypothetical protein